MTDPASEALASALSALARKEQTTVEVAGLLERRGHDAEAISVAVEELTGTGQLDDRRFARRYAEDKRELSGWGAERIAKALAARGIPAELVDEALGDETDAAQADRASKLLARDGRPLSDDADRARALRFLAGRGYGFEVAHEAIRIASSRIDGAHRVA